MKQAMTLTELAAELERQNGAKKDYVAPTTAMSLIPAGSNAGKVQIHGVGNFAMTQHARRQLAEKLDIPFAYFQRLEGQYPALLAENVNTILQREPSRNMVRTLDGNIRAFLSDRYRPLDNYDLADAIIPALIEANVQVESCNVTETKMYIKARMPWLDRELPVPEGLKMGVGHNFFVRRIEAALTITNSEVGAGMVAINPGIFERQCTNLAVFKDEGFGRMHIGKKAGDNENGGVSAYLSDETKRADDRAVWLKVRDVVKATMDGRVMDAIVAKLNAARADEITGDPAKVVEVFAKKEGLNEAEKGGLLRHLAGSGEMTRYGLQWAVTRLAGDVEDYDRASELERMGGRVIELAANDWKVLAKAA
jgi:hypothetical protein